MKKYILPLFLLVCITTNLLAQTSQPACCPEFKLIVKDITPCPGDNTCRDSATADAANTFFACKDQQHQYLVVPNLPAEFTYNWDVTGGTVVDTPSNPATIHWGNSSQGFIQVIISNDDGTCRDTIKQKVCLLNSPVADISFSPNPVCANSTVSFIGDQSIGGNYYFWDFGDGNYSNEINPQHPYNQSGNYTVILTVSNIRLDSPKEGIFFCGCSDTAMVSIEVLSDEALEIIPGCKKMLCFGDTSTYSTTTNCTNIVWTPIGGNIVGSANNANVTVVWDNPGTFPSSITLNANCNNSCGNSATLEVPVLFDNIPIEGPTNVCTGSGSLYSLPAMPGTFYTWSITPATGGTIVSESLNNNQIRVLWGGSLGGPYTIKCIYTNPYSGCSGETSIPVNIKLVLKINGLPQICASSTSNATYNIGGGYANWSITTYPVGYTGSIAFNNAQSINILFNVAGNYSIKAEAVNQNNYCTPSATINVVVNPTPVLNPIVGLNPICPNQLYDYSVSSDVEGGIYTWTVTPMNPGTIIAPYGENNSSVSISFMEPGVSEAWTLKAIQTVNGCTGNITKTINKLPAPSLPTAPINVCIGSLTPPIEASGTGPFTWSTSPGASLYSGQGTSQAVYEIHSNSTITVSNCSGPSNAIAVTATMPLPISITPNDGSLCEGNLELIATTGSAYQWFGGSNDTTQTINVTASGTYTVQVTGMGGCISVDSYHVLPEPIPTVTISTGDPLTWCNPAIPSVKLQAYTLSTGCTFQWYKNGILISSATANNYLATSAGSYYVVVSCSGCMDTSNSINIQQIDCPEGCPTKTNPLSNISETGCNPKTFSVNVTGCPNGIVTWSFGDGYTATGITVTHTYLNAGAFPVTASITCNVCSYLVHANTNVPVKADFNYSIQCGLNGSNTITLNNTSQTLGGWNITSVGWTSNCETQATGSGNTYILNTQANCSPTVTMNIIVTNPTTEQTCTDSKTFAFNFASAPLSIIEPPSVCKDQLYNFSSSMTTGVVNYLWKVNGTPVSQNSELNYAFNGTPPNPVITLSVTDQNGCIFTATKTVTVKTPVPLAITGPASVCPDCPPTNSLAITNSSDFNNYQWYQNGAIISSANGQNYQLCTFNASGNYYATATHVGTGCAVTSNSLQVVYKPKPVAKIIGNSVQCSSNFSLSSTNNNNCT